MKRIFTFSRTGSDASSSRSAMEPHWLKSSLTLLGMLGTFWVPAYAQPASTGAQSIDEVVAVVNSGLITRKEMLDRATLVERQFRAANRPLPPRADLLGEVLERLIIERVQVQMASDTGLKVTDADLDKALEQMAKGNNMTVEQYREQLIRAGVKFSKFREDLRQDIQVARLREREVDSKVQVFESEIDSYLAERAGGAKNAGEELDISQILVVVPEGAPPAQVTQLRAKAQDILQQARSNPNFEAVANQHIDAAGQVRAGDLGYRTPDRLPQLFVDAVSSLRPGELAEIVQSPNGFHILKLRNRRENESLRFGTIKVPQSRVRQILLRIGSGVSEAEAKKRLASIKLRVANGADFGDMARLYSQDGSASNAGELGWVSPGETVPEFEAAMNALQPGQISEPIRTEYGFHLINVMGRREREIAAARQRDFARAAIRERKLEQAYQDWLRQLRENAYVEYRVGNSR